MAGAQQGRDFNAIFWANICGTACPKDAKICGKIIELCGGYVAKICICGEYFLVHILIAGNSSH